MMEEMEHMMESEATMNNMGVITEQNGSGEVGEIGEVGGHGGLGGEIATETGSKTASPGDSNED